MSLRSKIVRVAYDNPELRPYLLPMLRKRSSRSVTDGIVYKNFMGSTVLSTDEPYPSVVYVSKGDFADGGSFFKVYNEDHVGTERYYKSEKKALEYGRSILRDIAHDYFRRMNP